MGIQKIRDLRRRQRRKKKMKALKIRLSEASGPKERAKLIEKLRRISLHPNQEMPKE